MVLLAYSRGITSSRTMAGACAENVIFIALACDQQPHFTALANFVTTLGKEVEAVFRDVLMVCNAQGVIGKNLFAIDGCKLPSNAARNGAVHVPTSSARRRRWNAPSLTWVIVGDLKKIEEPIRALKLGELKVLDADGKKLR